MSEIRNLTRNGETFYPLTCTDAVIDRDGNPVEIINDIFDISEYHASGTPPVLAKYASLDLALADVPQSKRKGGMTVRYVQTSDNKYVQYRYMGTDVTTAVTFTNTANWQGVDITPTHGSLNLIESGGIFDKYDFKTSLVADDIAAGTSIKLPKKRMHNGSLQGAGTGAPNSTTNNLYSDFIHVIPGSQIQFTYDTLQDYYIKLRIQGRTSDNFTDGQRWTLIQLAYATPASITIPYWCNFISIGCEIRKRSDDSAAQPTMDYYNENMFSFVCDNPIVMDYYHVYDEFEKVRSDIQELSDDTKNKMVLFFKGDGNNFVETGYNTDISANKVYRLHVLNPNFAHDEVTASGSSILFCVHTYINGTRDYFAYVTLNGTVSEYYEFIIPQGFDKLYIGGRANIGTNVFISLEEICRDAAINNSFANDVEVLGDNYVFGGYIRNGGTINPTNNYSYSVNVPCKEGDSIGYHYVTATGTMAIVFFDISGAFISGFNAYLESGYRLIIAPENAAYLAASFKNTDIDDVWVSVNGIITWVPIKRNNPIMYLLMRKVRPLNSITLNTDDFEYGSLQGGGTGAPIYFNNNAYSRFIKVVPGSKVYFHYKTLTIGGETAEIRIRVQARKSDNFTDGNSWRLIHTGYSQVDSVTIPSGFDYISIGIGYYINGVGVNKDILNIYNDGLSISSDDVIEITHNYLKELDLLSTNSNDIVMNNSPKEYQGILANMKRARKVGSSSTTSTPPPLVMLHFSDIHGNVMNVRRIVRFYDHYKNYIDDVIHTGDTVYNTVSDPSELWDTDDTKWWLNVIGNHDENGDTSANPALTAYNRFFAPYIEYWNVVQPEDASDGKLYYYKDYVDNKIRLIVLNCMNYDSAQNTWFVSVLSDVLTNHSDYSVIVSQHYPMNGNQSVLIDCNFTSYVEEDNRSSTGMPNDIINAVDDFIGNGGKFICHLTGHTHRDIVEYSSQSTKKQLCVVADTSNCHNPGWDDGDRASGTKMQDAFNIICFDTYAGLIKIVKVGKTWNQQMQHTFTIVLKYDETGVETPVVVREN